MTNDLSITQEQADGSLKKVVLPPATQGEAEAGTESGLRMFSPLRVAQAIAALAGGSTPPTAITALANVKFGAAAGSGITHVIPASPAFGDKAEYVITASGSDRNFTITTGILKPSNSAFDRSAGVSLIVSKPNIILFKCVVAGTWMLVSIVGGGE